MFLNPGCSDFLLSCFAVNTPNAGLQIKRDRGAVDAVGYSCHDYCASCCFHLWRVVLQVLGA